MENNHVAESGHWYEPDGKPAYTIIGKNGKERPTTLRDARKLGLLPSVTSIIRCAAAPGLERWKSEQVLMAALTTERLPEETEQDYIDRIIRDSQEQSLKARERGTLIHAWVQGGFEGELQMDDNNRFYLSALATILESCGENDWLCELSFATDRYAGKVDLNNSDDIIIDIKTTEKDLTDIKTWDEHALQLAAYSVGLMGCLVKCGILYINVNTAESKLIWIAPEELERGWSMFNALLDYYYAKTGLGG